MKGAWIFVLALAAYADADSNEQEPEPGLPGDDGGGGRDETVIGITICNDEPASGLNLEGTREIVGDVGNPQRRGWPSPPPSPVPVSSI